MAIVTKSRGLEIVTYHKGLYIRTGSLPILLKSRIERVGVKLSIGLYI